MRRPRRQRLLDRPEVFLHEERKRGGLLLLRLGAVGVELAQKLQAPVAHAARLERHVDGLAVPAVLLPAPRLRAPVLVRLVDGVRVARVHRHHRVHPHHPRRPLLEHAPVRRLGALIQQPGGGVAHLVQQRRLELLRRVQNLRAELDPRVVFALPAAPRDLPVVRQTRRRQELGVPRYLERLGQRPAEPVAVKLAVQLPRDGLPVPRVVERFPRFRRRSQRRGERLAVRGGRLAVPGVPRARGLARGEGALGRLRVRRGRLRRRRRGPNLVRIRGRGGERNRRGGGVVILLLFLVVLLLALVREIDERDGAAGRFSGRSSLRSRGPDAGGHPRAPIRLDRRARSVRVVLHLVLIVDDDKVIGVNVRLHTCTFILIVGMHYI